MDPVRFFGTNYASWLSELRIQVVGAGEFIEGAQGQKCSYACFGRLRNIATQEMLAAIPTCQKTLCCVGPAWAASRTLCSTQSCSTAQTFTPLHSREELAGTAGLLLKE